MVNTQTSYRKTYTEKRLTKAFDYLGGVCVVCGSKDTLEFDHVDPSLKVECISTAIMAKCWSWERLQVELDKCQLLCCKHHKEKTVRTGEYGGGQNKIKNSEHGTWAKYTNEKCRCPKCRFWRKQYRHKIVDAHGNPILQD